MAINKRKAEKKSKINEHSVAIGEHVIFRSGEHITKSGEKVVYTDRDLDEMCETFPKEEDQQPAYIVGHSSDYPIPTAIPAFGRIKGGLKRIGHDLVACGAEFSSELASWVDSGFYTERSCEIEKENGKRKLFCVSMLGARPPAVSGMPSIVAAMINPSFAFSSKTSEVQEFADSVDGELNLTDHLEAIEEAGNENTKTSIAEILAQFTTEIETAIDNDAEQSILFQKVYDMTNELSSELQLHSAFGEKLGQIEDCNEHSQPSFWQEFAKRFKSIITNNKQKESDMTPEQEKELKDLREKNTALETQVKEFSTAKAKTEAETKEAAIKKEVVEFCEAKIKDGKMTPAIRQVDEPIMIELSKASPDALKSFREKYTVPIVPLGTETQVDKQSNPQKSVVELAKAYVEKHHSEFSKVSDAEAVSFVIQQHVNGSINLIQSQSQS